MTTHVAYAADEQYWLPFYVSVTSLLENNQERTFEIHVLTDETNRDLTENISHLHRIHDDCTVTVQPVGSKTFDGFPTPKHFSTANYYRLRLGSLLPADAERVLYLDCDTLVVDLLDELLDRDLDEYGAAAVPHFKLKSLFHGQAVNEPWYNTGVMYIDLDAWRQSEIERKCIECIEGTDTLDYPLQEILNTVFHREEFWTAMGPEYNLMSDWIAAFEGREMDVEPRIVHFTASNKPWQYRTHRPYKDTWWEYLQSTPYRDYSPPDKNMKNHVIYSADKWLDSHPLLRELVSPIYARMAG